MPDTRGGTGYEPPAAIQNAMMTKDKKPFTYTPGGLDLSQIRSPRMQRRITRNANAEGVSDQPQVGILSLLTPTDTVTLNTYCLEFPFHSFTVQNVPLSRNISFVFEGVV